MPHLATIPPKIFTSHFVKGPRVLQTTVLHVSPFPPNRRPHLSLSQAQPPHPSLFAVSPLRSRRFNMGGWKNTGAGGGTSLYPFLGIRLGGYSYERGGGEFKFVVLGFKKGK
ncbi:hypothetical protein M404DRAFT_529824 [Pisolithus tinctorius Marx 270]|uniref:Uncharacterized protein n=1 Tax=Pisolithus tinctorius Marx 270 TaxID=870435 RepID=A0A0C3J7E2_PISTI|nr:hypothetical protein M404DRAFT_529824 [Pisolithus tinctorius Marx 270]